MNKIRPSDRVRLISEIGRAIQDSMKVADISAYLAAFGIRAEFRAPVHSKWVLVRELLARESDEAILAIARDLRLAFTTATAPAALDLAQMLSKHGMSICEEDFARAVATVDAGPAEAIGHACTSLESICKAIIHALGAPMPRDESLKSLVRVVAEQLELSPEKHADADLKQLLGGLTNAAAGIAVIRTKYSAFHGKSPTQRRLVARHARLAVNSAAAVGFFLVETYLARTHDVKMA